MKFSVRTLYGLKAVLLLAERYCEGSVSVSHIARKEGISTPYLEQILNALKKKGIVKSVRGPQGGYILAKKPSEVCLYELFGALEGEKLLEFSGKVPVSAASDEPALAHFLFWKKFESLLRDELGGIHLKGLLDDARQAKKAKAASRQQTFHI